MGWGAVGAGVILVVLREKPLHLSSTVVTRIYSRAYIHLSFNHAVLGTHLSYLGCPSRTVS